MSYLRGTHQCGKNFVDTAKLSYEVATRIEVPVRSRLGRTRGRSRAARDVDFGLDASFDLGFDGIQYCGNLI
jgi:hypothetical protein